jgi:HEAT repeat protein
VNEWDDVRMALAAEGIDPADFGRFVNRGVPGVMEPSTFDAARATPVLLTCLGRVTDPTLKQAIVAHLKTRAAKGVAAPALIEAFREAEDEELRWQIGDTLQATMTPEHHDAVLALAEDRRYGIGRQMLVDSLWRMKSDRVEPVLQNALTDPDVALHAGSALRRVIGNERAVARLEPLVGHEDKRVLQAACWNLKRARRALAKRSP